MKLTFLSTLAVAALSLPLLAAAQDADSARSRMIEKFKSTDTDGNGVLSRAEMEKGMPRLAKHFDEIDTDHDGSVTPAELRNFFASRKSG